MDATYLLRTDEKSVCVLILKKSRVNFSDFSQSFDWVSQCSEGTVVGKRVGDRR